MPLPFKLDAHLHKSALDKIKLRAQEAAHDVAAPQRHVLVDLTVQFIGAEGLPKMDVVGTADPYLVATIDDKIKFTSVLPPKDVVELRMWHD